MKEGRVGVVELVNISFFFFLINSFGIQGKKRTGVGYGWSST